MGSLNQGPFREQISFLRRQFLQDGGLPFTDVLSVQSISDALSQNGVCWKERIYSPLVTLWVFLGQVLSADPSCRAAVARLIVHRIPVQALPFVLRKIEPVGNWTTRRLMMVRQRSVGK